MAKFKVCGNRTVDGVAPGGEVEIEDEARARALQRGGHIEPALAEALEDRPSAKPEAKTKKGGK